MGEIDDQPQRAPGGPVRRYLIVANQTIGGGALMRALRERVAKGPAELHVVVPATPPRDYVRLAALSVDPLSGGFIPDLPGLAEAGEEGTRRARARLDEQLALLAVEGVKATGEVGNADPLEAIAAACSRSRFDEVVLSTLPASASRWLKLDLPARAQRRV